MGSNSSAKKESRRCIRCFSPLELMGIVPGSTTTTIPVTTFIEEVVMCSKGYSMDHLMLFKEATSDHRHNV